MKLHFQEIFKRNLVVILFCLTTFMFIILMFVSINIFKQSKKPFIIAIDNNGTRTVTELDDPIYKTEALVFIKNFAQNAYNFDVHNFMQRIGIVTNMMSDDLWKQKRTEILNLKDRIEKDEVSIEGHILEISKDELGVYHGLISLREKSRFQIKNHKLKVTWQLKQVPRAHTNPAGLEVESYEETVISN